MIRTWKEFALSQVSISDEAMEDLETFNIKYGNNYPTKDCFENMFNYERIGNDMKVSLIQNKDKYMFSLEMYLRRVLNGKNVTKQNLINIAKEIISVNGVNTEVLAFVKGIKKNTKKSNLVNIIINIINSILYSKYSN